MLNESLGKQKIVITTIDESEVPRSILREAIAWCVSRADRSLRTPLISPRVLEFSYRDAVRSVVQARRLHSTGIRLLDDLPEGGRLVVVQRGTHTELLKLQGLYAELYQRQPSVPGTTMSSRPQ